MKNTKMNLKDCILCPRNCHVNRLEGQVGFCGQTSELYAARASLHMWEEPCISGQTGSGTVFFSGCNMRCVFCQNHKISTGKSGKELSPSRLCEIFLELQEKNAANINLVTPTHFVPQIIKALTLAKSQGLTLPIVYNTGSYEKVETLKELEGLIDIYLPDLKYISSALSKKYSHAEDYFLYAAPAIEEMVRQTGKPVFAPQSPASPEPNRSQDDYAGPLMKKGVIVRHLVLPNCMEDSKSVIRYLFSAFGNDIYVSIMNQYTPLPQFLDIKAYPELNRTITAKEYDRLIDYALSLGLENGFIQDGETCLESFIPPFDCSGI